MPPGSGGPNGGPPNTAPIPDDTCPQAGSIILCESQVLGEEVGVTGTPFRLRYGSDRVPGHGSALRITLSGASLPTTPPERIDLEIDIGGRQFTQSFPAAPNESDTFTWDGLDAYGRRMQGPQVATVRIGYVYQAVYATPDEQDPSFASFGVTDVTLGPARDAFTLWQVWQRTIGGWDARSAQNLGGWTLNVQHAYDPVGRVLYLGDGTQRSAQSLSTIIVRVAGTGAFAPFGNDGDGGPATAARFGLPTDIAVGPDGSLYVTDSFYGRVRRVGPDGIISTVAGNGQLCIATQRCGDGGPATQAELVDPLGIAVGPDGSLYITDEGNSRIRRVGPDGIISTVAGSGQVCADPTQPCGDGGPATQAQLYTPTGIAVGPDGSLYIVDELEQRIRRVGSNGVITTVAGNGQQCLPTTTPCGDGGPAAQAELYEPTSVAVGPDGSLYIGDGTHRIRRVGSDGVINTVAGSGQQCSFLSLPCGDGGPATGALLSGSAVTVGPDGSLYVADSGPDNGTDRIRRIGPDGVITTVAGSGPGCQPYGTLPGPSPLPCGDGGPATQARLHMPGGVAMGLDGSLYIADTNNGRIRRVGTPLAGVSSTDIIIPVQDGSELYVFNAAGQHLRTLDALTGALRYSFGYDGAGRLVGVTDAYSNTTTIERDGNGDPTAIVAPGGQRTALTLDANGFLSSIADPLSHTVALTSTADGLLTDLTDPNGNTHTFTYDNVGRLVRDQDPAGGVSTLARTDSTDGYTVTVTTALSRTTTYSVEQLPTGDVRHTIVDPSGASTTALIHTDGSQTIRYPDGSAITQTVGPDPRWGVLAPFLAAQRVSTPGGLVQTLVSTRTATLRNPTDLLSLQSLTDTISLNGRTSTSRYVASSGTISVTTPSGRSVAIALDAHGRIASTAIPGLLPVQYARDLRGRPAALVQGTRAYTATFDDQNNLAAVADPLSDTVGLASDPAGRVMMESLPDGSQMGFAYDANGNTAAITPPGRSSYGFTFTPLNLLQDYVPPDAGAGSTPTHYAYNVDRQLARVQRPDGSSVSLGYDTAGRLATVTVPRGTVTYAYDPHTAHLGTITAPDGGLMSFGYDGALPTDITWSGAVTGALHQTYDNNLRLSGDSVDGAPPIAYQYDNDGLLTAAGAITLSHDPLNGRLTGSTLGAIADSVGYDAYGEITSYQATTSTATPPLYALADTRDNLGRIVQKTETVLGVTHVYSYTYDLNGRLTEVDRDGIIVDQYGYDANGNRSSATSPASGTAVATFDGQDRLLLDGATAYTYTASGDVLGITDAAHTTTYRYDALGNLTHVTLPDGTPIDYVLDGANHRIGKRVNGALVQGFLYDATHIGPIAELDGHNQVVSRFVYGSRSNVPDYMIRGGVSYRIISDERGSPHLVVDASSGAVVQQMEYDAFGRVTGDTAPGFQPFGFAGGLYDPQTGLVRFGARDYDAQTGRWMAQDPIRFAGAQANLYVYAGDDPVNLVDPSGQIIPLLVAAGVAGIVGGVVNYLTAGDQATWQDFAAGFAGGVVGTAVGAALGTGLIAGAIAGAAGQGTSQLVGNLLKDCPSWSKGLLPALGAGALVGAPFGLAGGAFEGRPSESIANALGAAASSGFTNAAQGLYETAQTW